jgi:hypothetical protein
MMGSQNGGATAFPFNFFFFFSRPILQLPLITFNPDPHPPMTEIRLLRPHFK